VVVLGALSAVAQAVARRYAGRGAALALAARNGAELRLLADDLSARGATAVVPFELDLAGCEPDVRLAEMAEALDGMDVVVLAYGALTDQARAERELDYAAGQLATNFTSAALWCLAVAGRLEAQDHGVLVVLGSVAGDRGRGSNYVYGAAKAGLAALMQGIAHRLARGRARAVLIKPGFIDTPMTAHLAKGGPLWASPDAIAAVVVAAADRGGSVRYAPWFWRPIMLIVRALPAAVLHRTRL
jgi:NAD(P)-dependent dehydrogenase (short-subunit alcohol dehydrogenase family)